MRSRAAVTVLALALLLPLAATAQGAAPAEPPQVTGSGSIDVVLPAARATIMLTLTGEGMDAHGARLALDSVRSAVDAAVARLGLTAQPYGMGLGENQQIRRMLPQGQDVRTSRDVLMRIGLSIEVPNVARTAEVLDALFAAGVKGPLSAVYSAAEDDPRLQAAITRATALARKEAERLAAAAGGRVGALRQLSRDPSFPGQGVMARVGYTVMDGSGVNVPPGDIALNVRVRGAWEFVPNP